MADGVGRGGASAIARSSAGLGWLATTFQLTERPLTVPLVSITRPGKVTEISNDINCMNACWFWGFCSATFPPYFLGSSGRLNR